MDLSFTGFINNFISNPTFIVITVLLLCVVLVNGWTDAPNAIATCVSTKSLSPKKAILLAAVFNFLGVLIMTLISSTVAQTIYNLVDFGNNYSSSLIALCAGLFAIVVWAVLAWIFGIPTSESHALIAGVSGAAIALQHSFSALNGNAWLKIFLGLVFSTAFGFSLGYVLTKVIEQIFKPFDRRKTTPFFKTTQIVSSMAMAFMHGAQDGQKFIGIFLMALFLSKGTMSPDIITIPIWLSILISLTMTLGTSIGGHRIIKTVGLKMTKLEPYKGTAADLASATTLLISSVSGMPVSTTHTKTTAIMGVGASKRWSNVRWDIVKNMFLAWFLTFPGCGLLGYLVTKLFIHFFA